MQYQIEYSPSARSMVDRGLRVWFRKDAYTYIYYLGFPLLVLSLCLVSPEFTQSRAGNLVIGILLGIIATISFQLLYALLTLKPKAQQIVHRLVGQTIRVYCNDEGIGVEVDGKTESYQWKHINTLWQQPTAWLLFHNASEFVSFPLESMSEGQKQFMVDKATEVGSRITT